MTLDLRAAAGEKVLPAGTYNVGNDGAVGTLVIIPARNQPRSHYILSINSCRMYPFRKRLGTDISALKKRRFFFAYFI